MKVRMRILSDTFRNLSTKRENDCLNGILKVMCSAQRTMEPMKFLYLPIEHFLMFHFYSQSALMSYLSVPVKYKYV